MATIKFHVSLSSSREKRASPGTVADIRARNARSLVTVRFLGILRRISRRRLFLAALRIPWTLAAEKYPRGRFYRNISFGDRNGNWVPCNLKCAV